jgi:large subunit ribosomal protein L18
MSRAKDLLKRDALRLRRKKRVRGKISGCAERPRLTVFKSNKYFYAQAIDDIASQTLAA